MINKLEKIHKEYVTFVNDKFIENLNKEESEKFFCIEDIYSLRVSALKNISMLEAIQNDIPMFKEEIKFLLESESVTEDQKETLRNFKKIFKKIN